MRRILIGIFIECRLLPLISNSITSPAHPPKIRRKTPSLPSLRNSYAVTQDYLSRAAQQMPEEYYAMRPGPQPEVRTFGQIIGHLANYNYMECSDARGEKNPNAGTDFEHLTAKADSGPRARSPPYPTAPPPTPF